MTSNPTTSEATNPTASNPNSRSEIRNKAARAALSRWKLETLTGLLGLDTLEKHASMSQANQEAENRWARKHVWGEDIEVKHTGSGETDAADQMGHDMGHVLGDLTVTHPTPIVVANQPAKSSNWSTAALVMAALLPTSVATGLAGYFLASQGKNPPTPVERSYEDETISIGLGRLEDFGLD